MDEAQEIIRCRNCELVQWRDRENCRRCGAALPKPIVKIVENVVQEIIVRRDPLCLEELQQARQQRAAASESLAQSDLEPVLGAWPDRRRGHGRIPYDGGDGAHDDPGRLSKDESQTARSGQVVGHRQNDLLSETSRERKLRVVSIQPMALWRDNVERQNDLSTGRRSL